MPDVQASKDTREIAIQRVGVRDLTFPVQVRQRTQNWQASVASCGMYVHLPAEQKGTHMSRFVELLAADGLWVEPRTISDLLAKTADRLNAKAAYLSLSFPFFLDKAAPVTGAQAPMDYQVRLVGRYRQGESELRLKVVVPVTSLCPCSKKIARYGAHNQRSHVTVELVTQGDPWIEDIIDWVEQEASCELYALLKRADEQQITERAYDNPKFVEDMVRDVAAKLAAQPGISRYRVECENFESIHNHSAYAVIEQGLP